MDTPSALADEVARLRACLNDLVSVVAPQVLGTEREPRQIVDSLLDALTGMLGLAFVFVRLNDPDGRQPIEIVRIGSSSERIGNADFSFASVRLGLLGELGIVVAASENPDFPSEMDRLLLDVAANQAAVGVRQAHLLNEHARRASEGEREWRLIVDNIPGLVALLSAAGEVEVVNRRLLEYFGQTLDELRRWGTNGTVHPEDLPHVVEVFTQSISSGTPYEIVQRLRRADGVYRWIQNSGFPLRDTHGHIARWCVLLTDVDDRMLAEDALRRSERESRLIVDSIPGFIAAFTPQGELEFVNRPILDYFGKSWEELQGWATSGMTHPDDVPRVVELFSHSIATGAPFEFEVRARRSDGVYRWFQSRGFPLRDTNGHIVRWYNVLVDVDERKRAEEALRASEREFRLLVETIPALVWRGTPEGELDYLNQRAVEYLGHTAEALAGGRWLELVHPEHRDATLRRWLQSATTGSSYEDVYQLRRADGEYRWIQSVGDPFHDIEGRIVHWYGVVIDIEDRKRAEIELRRAYDSFADGQRLSRTGNFTADIVADDHVWSTELYHIFEIDPGAKITVQAVRDLIHSDDLPSFDAGFARSLGGADFDHVFRIVTRSGRLKHVHAIGHLVEKIGSRPLFIGAIQDVTEGKVAEEALNKARSELAHVARAATVSALTASIAHEVNQPLAGIITNASTCLRMLGADPPDVEGARETAKRTIRDGNRASEVVSRLRALFRKKEFTLEPLDLNEAAREVIALSSSDLQRNRVIVQAEFAEDLPKITGDRVQLQQVILNLLRNASDAMVVIQDRPRQLLLKTVRENGDGVRLSVRDTGVGFDRQDMEKLFDAFYTTKSDGMGIGLSVSRSIIERHQGRLWAEPNHRGPGATFSFSIPRSPEDSSDP